MWSSEGGKDKKSEQIEKRNGLSSKIYPCQSSQDKIEQKRQRIFFIFIKAAIYPYKKNRGPAGQKD